MLLLSSGDWRQAPRSLKLTLGFLYVFLYWTNGDIVTLPALIKTILFSFFYNSVHWYNQFCARQLRLTKDPPVTISPCAARSPSLSSKQPSWDSEGADGPSIRQARWAGEDGVMPAGFWSVLILLTWSLLAFARSKKLANEGQMREKDIVCLGRSWWNSLSQGNL